MPARVDQASDPEIVADLATVRLGTAFFRRALNRLNDQDLNGASLLPGWSRRHVVAHVGYNARALARLVDWAATGIETPMYSSPDARTAEIEFGATLPPEALRNLIEHSAIDLDVRWRDLPADRWSYPVVTAQGRTVPAAETVWLRCREIWLHAVDLDSGCRLDQVPARVLSRLIGDIYRTWVGRGTGPLPHLVATDTADQWGSAADDGSTVSGTLVSLAGWAMGRMSPETRAGALSSTRAEAVGPAPRWL